MGTSERCLFLGQQPVRWKREVVDDKILDCEVEIHAYSVVYSDFK